MNRALNGVSRVPRYRSHVRPRDEPTPRCRTSRLAQQQVAEKLKTGLAQMRDKLDELTAKRNELVARAKTAEAQSQVQDAIKSIAGVGIGRR